MQYIRNNHNEPHPNIIVSISVSSNFLPHSTKYIFFSMFVFYKKNHLLFFAVHLFWPPQQRNVKNITIPPKKKKKISRTTCLHFLSHCFPHSSPLPQQSLSLLFPLAIIDFTSLRQRRHQNPFVDVVRQFFR